MFGLTIGVLPECIREVARSTQRALRRAPSNTRPRLTDTNVAASALLLEVAHADREFTDTERRHLEATMRGQFGLQRSRAERLMAAAEEAREDHSGIWYFTNALHEGYSDEQKEVLCDLMAGVAHVDGAPSREEAYVLRKACTLLRSEPTTV